MYDPSKENTETKKNIEIRGRYIMMACDIEFCLLNIIMFCHPDPYNHTRVGQFTEMRMKNKIDNAIKDLKQHKPNYYIEFKNELDGLEEFREVRNDMSHCIGILNNDVKTFRVCFIDKEDPKDKANRNEFFKYRDYTEQYISESLTRFENINHRLGILWYRLKMEFEMKIGNSPFVHPTTRTS